MENKFILQRKNVQKVPKVTDAFAELKTSQIPVIMLTALEDEYTQVSSFDCLADDYMTKPFSMVVLGKRITALLRRAGGKEETKIWKYGDLTVDFSGYSACNSKGKNRCNAKRD